MREWFNLSWHGEKRYVVAKIKLGISSAEWYVRYKENKRYDFECWKWYMWWTPFFSVCVKPQLLAMAPTHNLGGG